MDILVNVASQKLKIATNLKSLVAGTQEFIRFVFNTSSDWDGLTAFAQFRQNGAAYNQYLDDDNAAYLPSEIGVGTCNVMLYGSGGNTIATTNYLTLTIDENILVSDASSTDITETLYQQILNEFNAVKDIAQSVRDDADNGMFKGEKGEKGDTGPQGLPGEMAGAYMKHVSDSRYANALTADTSGLIAALTDAWEGGTLSKCEIQGQTTETGTGTKGPGNPYALSGASPARVTACGKNLANNVQYPTVPQYLGCVYADAPLLPGTTYTISITVPTGEQFYANELIFAGNTGTGIGTGGRQSIKVTTQSVIPKNQYVSGMGWRLFKNSITTTTSGTASQLQIELGDTATDYEPYCGADYPLPELELYGLPNGICDTYDAATGVETRRIGKYELNGTEYINANSIIANETTTLFPFLGLLSGKESVPAAVTVGTTTHMPFEMVFNQDKMGAYTTGGNLYLRLPNSLAGSTEEAKSWLAAQYAAGTPVTVYYQLAEPAITEHEASAIRVPAETASVCADEGEVCITYTKDMNKTLTKLECLFAASTGWNGVQNAVRLGLGEKLFPVGHEFTTRDADTDAEIVWVVRGHDHHQAANTRLTHSMTLETKYVYGNAAGAYLPLQYDAVEALYYAAEGLAPGTYHFTVANQSWFAADNGKSYQFTLAQAVPAGGQIVLNAVYNQTLAGKTASTFAGSASTTVIETVTLTEGNGGTSLGTTDGTGNVNHFHHTVYGSNNYAQSAVRQWLNSAAAAGSVWTAATKFDRPPSWAATYNGFVHGLPEDFLKVVEPAAIPCRTNSVYETASLDGTAFAVNQVYILKDRFFLLSRPEMYGTWDSAAVKDGEVLPYYDGLDDTDRIKRDSGGTARNTWLRSPNYVHSHSARSVFTGNGAVSGNAVQAAVAVAPACIIA